MTKAPGRYSEASLVKALEKMGIGRPSTYASIISRIKSAGYVKIDKKRLTSTTTGETLIDFLVEKHPFVIDYTTTRKMEEYLDKVAEGGEDVSWQKFAKATHFKMDYFKPEQRGGGEAKAPSEKQIAFAQQIAEKNELKIPEKTLESSYELSKWIDKHIKSKKGKKAA